MVNTNKLCTVRGFSITYAPNIPGRIIALGVSTSTCAVAPLLFGNQNVFMFPRNVKWVSNYALLSSPLFVIHSHHFFGKRIDVGVENSPRSPRNAIYFWSKSAFPLIAKNLLAECTALMVINFPTMHPNMIGSIMIRNTPCITDACAFDSRCPSGFSLVWASSIAKKLLRTAPFCVDVFVGNTTAPAGCWTGCVGGVGSSCTPCVSVVGPPVFFVRTLISVKETVFSLVLFLLHGCNKYANDGVGHLPNNIG